MSVFHDANSKRGPVCWHKTIKLTPAKWRDLNEAMDDATVEGTAIARVLRDWGHKVTGNQVRSHRRRECSCAR